MKITLTTTEGVKEFERIASIEEFPDFDGNETYTLTPLDPRELDVEVNVSKVLFIRIDKENGN